MAQRSIADSRGGRRSRPSFTFGVRRSRPVFTFACLSLAAGCTDVLSFLKLGSVFTSAMTGNAALLAVAVGRGDWVGAALALCALAAFSLGVAIGAILGGEGRRAFRRLLGIELVSIIACAALWSAGPDPLHGGLLYVVIALSAISMGLQAVAARTVDSSGISTVVFTTVLIRIVMSAASAMARRAPPAAERTDIRPLVGSFVAYAIGALLAAVLAPRFLGALIWLPAVAVAISLAAELADREA